MTVLAVEDQSIAILKPPMLTLLTNIGSQGSKSVTWSVPTAGFSPNEQLVDVLTCNPVNADDKGGVNVVSLYGMPQVLMPVTTLSKGGTLCPDMAMGRRAANTATDLKVVSWTLLLVGVVLIGKVKFGLA